MSAAPDVALLLDIPPLICYTLCMKNRRDFLKLIGIGAGAAASVALAVVAGRGGTPVPPPRAIQDIEKKQPFIGPDPGDFSRRKPDILREYPIGPDLGNFDRFVPEIQKIGPDVNVLPDNVIQTPVFEHWTTTDTHETTGGSLNVTTNAAELQAMTVVLSPDMEVWRDSWDTIRADHERVGAGW